VEAQMSTWYFDITEAYDATNVIGPYWHAMTKADPGSWLDLMEFVATDLYNNKDVAIYGARNVTEPVSFMNNGDWWNEEYSNIKFDGWDRADGVGPWAITGSYVIFPNFAKVYRFCTDDAIVSNHYNITTLKCSYIKSESPILVSSIINAYGCTISAPVFDIGYSELDDEQYIFAGCLFDVAAFSSTFGHLLATGCIEFSDCLFIGKTQVEIETEFNNVSNLIFTNCQFVESNSFVFPGADNISAETLDYNDSGLEKVSLDSFDLDAYNFGFADDYRDGYGAWYFSDLPPPPDTSYFPKRNEINMLFPNRYR
jgi:hypothetical protein